MVRTKFWPVGGVDPGGAQHDRARAGGQHRLLAGQLGGAIDAGAARRGRSRHRARPWRRRTRSRSRRGSAGCRPPRTAAPAPPGRRGWRDTPPRRRSRPRPPRCRRRRSPPARGRPRETPAAMLSGRSKSNAGRPTRHNAARPAAAPGRRRAGPVPPVTRNSVSRSPSFAAVRRHVRPRTSRAVRQPRQDRVLVRQQRLGCRRPARAAPGPDRSRSPRARRPGRTAR